MAETALAFEKRIRISTIIFALLSSTGILLLKFYAARISGSAAIRSDALESTVNVAAAAFGLWSILFTEKPADREHPYGHGKMEYFSAAFEGGLIALAGILILIDAASHLHHPDHLYELGKGLKLNLLAGALNGLLGMIMLWVGKRYQSTVIKADGIHLMSDLVTTGALTLGLGFVLATGWKIVDPLLAIGVAAFLLRTGFKMVKSAFNALLDAEDPALLEEIVKQLNELDRGPIIAIHDLKAQAFGRDRHIDLHVVVPEWFSIKAAHDLSDAFAHQLFNSMGKNTQVHTHVDPCNQLYCSTCSEKECPVRQQPFTGVIPLYRGRGHCT